jgi:hypothetical protein
MSAPFVTTLGVRPGTLRANSGTTTNTGEPLLTLRVHSAELWDAVRIEAYAGTSVSLVKQVALSALMPEVLLLADYVVKLHGREIRNEDLSLAAAGVKDGATLLVMSRRRHAVR